MSETLTDTESLVILGLAGAEGAERELAALNGRDVIKVATTLDRLVTRGLIEIEDGEYYPTLAACEAAQDFETAKVRKAATR